jgi:phenylacetate-CoA ligase
MKGYGLYERLPIALQNAVVAHYGRKLHRMRFGGVFEKRLDEIYRAEKMSPEELRAFQVEKLRVLLTEAVANVPHYKENAAEIRALVASMKDPAELERLPIIEKSTVSADSARFHAIKAREERFYASTSGTTGRPLATMKYRRSYQEQWAYLHRSKELWGVRMGMRRASFGTRMVVPPRQTKPPFWRFEPAENNVYFSLFHLSDRCLAHYCRKLVEWAPEEVVCYPSGITVVADYMNRHGIRLHSVRAIFAMAETLHDWQKEIIEPAFGAHVVNLYGLAENVAWFMECANQRIHIRPDYGYTELLKLDDAEPTGGLEGDVREIVATGFNNLAMPLVRYRTRDQVVITDRDREPCSCPLPFPTVSKVIGRLDDNLVTPDGRVQTRLDGIFKFIPGVRESQLEQVALDKLIVRIAPREDYSPAALDEVRKRIHQIFGAEMQVEFVVVEELPRTRAGKVRYQINSLPPEDRARARGVASAATRR